MRRKQNFQTIAWFWDLYSRRLLDLDPPYQRRSVWNQSYRDYYIDTILLGYPSPALFVYEVIADDGTAKYFVVDGKQRLSTIFSFVKGEFPVSEEATKTALRGKYWKDLSSEVKQEVWSYQFTVESLPSDEEGTINNIFDRINRNTAKLTPQELRHAKFNGAFIAYAEWASEEFAKQLGDNFPNIAPQQRRQMKDVELIANLILLIEKGPQGYSSAMLDEEFSKRDDVWDNSDETKKAFESTLKRLTELFATEEGAILKASRFRNQADFYALFGVVARLKPGQDVKSIASPLKNFIEKVGDEDLRASDTDAQAYYEATRSASNDAGPRKLRIEILARIAGLAQ
jgi:hypothetical protein